MEMSDYRPRSDYIINVYNDCMWNAHGIYHEMRPLMDTTLHVQFGERK